MYRFSAAGDATNRLTRVRRNANPQNSKTDTEEQNQHSNAMDTIVGLETAPRPLEQDHAPRA